MPAELIHKVKGKTFVSLDEGVTWSEKIVYKHVVDGRTYVSNDGIVWELYLSPASQTIKTAGDIGVKIGKWILAGKKETSDTDSGKQKRKATPKKSQKSWGDKFEGMNTSPFDSDDRWNRGPFD